MSTGPVNPGDVLMGKYRVERLLGMGTMGVVVAATHLGLNQRVALKFMLPGTSAQEEQYARFLREARASVRLRSEHVARVLDVGTLSSGAPYMVMEFLEGRDLGAVLADRGQLPIAEAVDYVLQACEAVAEAHGTGIVHRDLKPANLFLTASADGSPCVKVLDFGISKSSKGELQMTRENQVLGSPYYMSPEQMESSKDVDARSDIWALGVVLYELVAKKTPFHAEKIEQLCTRVFLGAPTPLATYRSDAPAGLEPVLLQCLQKDRELRFESVAELAAALAPYGSPRAAAYAEKVAGVLGVHLAPVRLTDVLPPEPTTLPVLASMAATTPLATPTQGTTTSAAVIVSTTRATSRSPRVGLVAGGIGVVTIGLAFGALVLMRDHSGAVSASGSAGSASASPGVATPPTPVAATPPASTMSSTAPSPAPQSNALPSVPADEPVPHGAIRAPASASLPVVPPAAKPSPIPVAPKVPPAATNKPPAHPTHNGYDDPK